MSFHHSAPLSFRAKPRNLSRWLAVAARTAPLRPHFTPLVSGLDPQPTGAARLPPDRRRQPPPAALHQPSFRTGSGIQVRGAPALPDTNRSTRRPVAVSSLRTIHEPPDVASNLKYLLQADDHGAAMLRRPLPLYGCDVGRTASPIATDFAARHNVHTKMRDALTSNHAVVLNQVEPVGVKWPHKGIGDPTDGMQLRKWSSRRSETDIWRPWRWGAVLLRLVVERKPVPLCVHKVGQSCPTIGAVGHATSVLLHAKTRILDIFYLEVESSPGQVACDASDA